MVSYTAACKPTMMISLQHTHITDLAVPGARRHQCLTAVTHVPLAQLLQILRRFQYVHHCKEETFNSFQHKWEIRVYSLLMVVSTSMAANKLDDILKTTNNAASHRMVYNKPPIWVNSGSTIVTWKIYVTGTKIPISKIHPASVTLGGLKTRFKERRIILIH